MGACFGSEADPADAIGQRGRAAGGYRPGDPPSRMVVAELCAESDRM